MSTKLIAPLIAILSSDVVHWVNFLLLISFDSSCFLMSINDFQYLLKIEAFIKDVFLVFKGDIILLQFCNMDRGSLLVFMRDERFFGWNYFLVTERFWRHILRDEPFHYCKLKQMFLPVFWCEWKRNYPLKGSDDDGLDLSLKEWCSYLSLALWWNSSKFRYDSIIIRPLERIVLFQFHMEERQEQLF